MTPPRIRPGGELLLGMVHLPPLPGSPRWDGTPIGRLVERARRDAEHLLEAGLDGYVVENFGDAPWFGDRVPAHVVASMTTLVAALPRRADAAGSEAPEAVVGVNVLRNDASAALGIAAALSLDLIRVNVHTGATVTDQGVLEGHAAELLRERAALRAEVTLAADVDVKHGRPLGGAADPAETARETAHRGLADALIVTGPATGRPADRAHLARVREAVPDRPVLVGSGVTPTTAPTLLGEADGLLVGSALEERGEAGNPVDPERARALVRAVRG